MIRSNFVTPMTREGVNCASKLSRDGSTDHYKRNAGPGSMSGKPYVKPIDRRGR